ncbi:MAG TPA: amidohydrolase family protein [Thermoanaerobaculaceae bacterium]|nr:amidohydrolase family protein [Thermoanaerobaculaceae bacterium]HPS77831.1 amidohydrolase family protein [Thermoanaerobaculaceae bacterium]
MSEDRAILISGGTVVPMTGREWHAADLLVVGDRIAEVGPGLTAPSGCFRLDARGALVLPGFVQTHVHVVQSLARHRAEGRPLLRWLRERIWPYEAALSPDEVDAAARLGIGELLCGGTTSALDMGTTHSQDVIFEVAAEMGIRFTSGKAMMDTGDGVPDALKEDTGVSLEDSERLGRRWHGAAGGRLRYALAPRFVLTCTEDLLRAAAEMSRRHGFMLHTHASESADETRAVRELTGRGNVAYFADLGLAGEATVLAHCVQLDDEEVAGLAATRTGVAHCPGSNLKLASGIADVPRLLAAGVRIGLGADGPPCNNRLSIFHEMALAGTLHNLRHGAGAVDAWTVLELATWRGAQVLGLDGRVGRLTPGRLADIVVLGCESWAAEPFADPADVVVFGLGVESVRHVLVDGAVVVEDGRLRTGDDARIRGRARAAGAAVAGRLGWS